MISTLSRWLGLQDEQQQAESSYERGLESLSYERWEEAADAFQDAVHFAPELVDVHWRLGFLLAERKRPREAITAFKNAIRYSYDLPQVGRQLDPSEGELARWQSALDACRTESANAPAESAP